MKKQWAIFALIMVACLAAVLFLSVQKSAPREVTWRDSIYTRSRQMRFEPDFAASLEPLLIGELIFCLPPTALAAPHPPLELYFPVGGGDYYLYEWSRDQAGDELLVRKPNIYLYSQHPQTFQLRLRLSGSLTASDPVYPPDGWTGTAYADGMIDRKIPFLFYECTTAVSLAEENGWCIERCNFPDWCERELAALGLNERERTDFMEYWSKVLPNSRYISIYLQPETVVEQVSELQITPVPDAMLRLLCYFVPTEEHRSVIRPEITLFERRGFTLVEWGGLLR